MPATAGLNVVLGLGVGSAVGLVFGAALVVAFARTSLGVSGLDGAETSALGAALAGSGVARFSEGLVPRCADLEVAESGRASCEEMMAGSTGAPRTVG